MLYASGKDIINYRESEPSIPVNSTVRISPVFIFIDTGPYPPHFSLSVYLISSMLKEDIRLIGENLLT